MNDVVNNESYFDGGLLQLIGWKLLGGLITVITFGICYPWAFCMIYRWEAKHTHFINDLFNMVKYEKFN